MIGLISPSLCTRKLELLMTVILKDYYLSGELEPILNSRQRTEERKLLERNKELCIRYYY